MSGQNRRFEQIHSGDGEVDPNWAVTHQDQSDQSVGATANLHEVDDETQTEPEPDTSPSEEEKAYTEEETHAILGAIRDVNDFIDTAIVDPVTRLLNVTSRDELSQQLGLPPRKKDLRERRRVLKRLEEEHPDAVRTSTIPRTFPFLRLLSVTRDVTTIRTAPAAMSAAEREIYPDNQIDELNRLKALAPNFAKSREAVRTFLLHNIPRERRLEILTSVGMNNPERFLRMVESHPDQKIPLGLTNSQYYNLVQKVHNEREEMLEDIAAENVRLRQHTDSSRIARSQITSPPSGIERSDPALGERIRELRENPGSYHHFAMRPDDVTIADIEGPGYTDTRAYRIILSGVPDEYERWMAALDYVEQRDYENSRAKERADKLVRARKLMKAIIKDENLRAEREEASRREKKNLPEPQYSYRTSLLLSLLGLVGGWGSRMEFRREFLHIFAPTGRRNLVDASWVSLKEGHTLTFQDTPAWLDTIAKWDTRIRRKYGLAENPPVGILKLSYGESEPLTFIVVRDSTGVLNKIRECIDLLPIVTDPAPAPREIMSLCKLMAPWPLPGELHSNTPKVREQAQQILETAKTQVSISSDQEVTIVELDIDPEAAEWFHHLFSDPTTTIPTPQN